MSLKVDALLQEKEALLAEDQKHDRQIEAIQLRKAAIKKQLNKLEKIIVLAADYEDLGSESPKSNGSRSPKNGRHIRLQLVEELANHPGLGVASGELGPAIGVDRNVALYHLNNLKRQGLVRSSGTGPKTKWHITKKGLNYDPA